MKKLLFGFVLSFLFSISLVSANDLLKDIRDKANDVTSAVNEVTGTINTVTNTFNSARNGIYSMNQLINTKNATAAEFVGLAKRFGVNLSPTANVPDNCKNALTAFTSQCEGLASQNSSNSQISFSGVADGIGGFVSGVSGVVGSVGSSVRNSITGACNDATDSAVIAACNAESVARRALQSCESQAGDSNTAFTACRSEYRALQAAEQERNRLITASRQASAVATGNNISTSNSVNNTSGPDEAKCRSLAQAYGTCMATSRAGGTQMDASAYNKAHGGAIVGGQGATFQLPDCGWFNFCGYTNIELRVLIMNIINFFLSFLGILAIAMIIYAGFLYVTSMGDDGNSEKAKKIILYAIIGLLVVLASYAIVNTVIRNAGLGGDDRSGASNVEFSTNTPQFNGSTGTVNTNTIGTGNGVNTSITAALNNPILIEGNNVIDSPGSTITTINSARDGLIFKMNVIGVGIFDFGDGTQGVLDTTNDPNATLIHVFGEEKTYNVRLLVETSTGQTSSYSKQLTVGGVKADFTYEPRTVRAGQKLTLNGSQSSTNKGTILDYNWTCSGGSGCFAPATGAVVEVTFTEPGSYQVELSTLASVGGLTDRKTEVIKVTADAPEAIFTFRPANVPSEPAQFIFDAAFSFGVDGSPEGLEYNWNFDGDLVRTNSPETRYTFESTGTKTVELLVVETLNGERILSETVGTDVVVESVLGSEFDILQQGSELLDNAGFTVGQ